MNRFSRTTLLVYCALLLELTTPSIARAEPPITALCFSPHGDRLLVASQRGLEIHDPRNGLRAEGGSVETIERLPPAIHDLQFSPDGDRLLIGGGIPAEVGTVVLLDWPTQSVVWRKEVGEDIIYGSDWSPDRRFIAVASFDGVCRILDGKDGGTIQSLAGHSAGLTDVAWINRQQVITASHDATLRRWNGSSSQLERTFNNHTGAVAGIIVKPPSPADSPPAELPVAASIAEDRTVRFWQPTIGRMMRFHRFESARPVCAAWTPDGNLLAVGTTAGQLVLVDPLSASVHETFDISYHGPSGWVTALAVQPDGKAIIAGTSSGSVERFAIFHGD